MKKKLRVLTVLFVIFAMVLCSCSSCSSCERVQGLIAKLTGGTESTESTGDETSGTEESTGESTEESGSEETETRTASGSTSEKDDKETSKKETKEHSGSGLTDGAKKGEKETTEKETTEKESSSETKKESSSETEKESSTEAKHTHTLQHVLKVDATCTADGSIEYWMCTGCGRCYKDAAATQYIEKPSDIVVKAKGHNPLFTKGYTPSPLTCMTEGTYGKYVCQNCGKEFLDEACTKEVKSEADLKYYGPHSLVHHPKTEATCTVQGNSEYWECSVCGDYFTDSTGKTKIANPTLVIIYPLGHDYGSLIEANPGCETSGWVAHYHCSRCGHYFDYLKADVGTDPTVFYLAPYGHSVTPSDYVASDPACKEPGGYSAHYICPECYEWFDLDMKTKRAPAEFYFAGDGSHFYKEVKVDGKLVYDDAHYAWLFRCTKCGKEIYLHPEG